MARDRWDLRRFKDLMDRRREATAAGLAASAADALSREFEFAEYHAWSAQALVKEALAQGQRRPAELPGVAALRQVLQESEPGRTELPLRKANCEARAHMVAFFRASHAATDLLAPVVYWGLGLDRKLRRPLHESTIGPPTVLEGLEKHGLHPRIHDEWSKLIDLDSYRYLRALANTMKHRHLVKAGFTVSLNFAPDARHGLQVGRFRYDRVYEPKWVSDYLANEHPAVVRSVIRVGRAMNAELRAERCAAL